MARDDAVSSSASHSNLETGEFSITSVTPKDLVAFTLEPRDSGINITGRSDFSFNSTVQSDFSINSTVQSDFSINSTVQSDIIINSTVQSDFSFNSTGRTDFGISNHERGEIGMNILKTSTLDLIIGEQTSQSFSDSPIGFFREELNLGIPPPWADPTRVPQLGAPVLLQCSNSIEFTPFLCYISMAFGLISIAANASTVAVALSRNYRELNKSILVALPLSNIIFASVESIYQVQYFMLARPFLVNLVEVYYLEFGAFLSELAQCFTIYLAVLLVTERFVAMTLPRRIAPLVTHSRLMLAELSLLIFCAGVNSRFLMSCGLKWLSNVRLGQLLPHCASFQQNIISPFHNHLKQPTSVITKSAVPFLLMLAGCIAIVVRTSRRPRDPAVRSAVAELNSAHQMRLARATVAMSASVSFLVLLPYAVFYFVYSLSGGRKHVLGCGQDANIMKFLGIFFHINSFVSFVIFVTMNRTFNGIFKTRICCCMRSS